MFGNQLKDKALQIRIDILNAIKKAKKGHIGGSYSIVEILVALYYGKIIQFDSKNPKSEKRDRLLLSKGHAGVALYAVLADLGFFPKEEMNFLNNKKMLGEHPDQFIPGIEFVSGSLGHGLGIGCGLAYLYKKKNIDKKVYVVISEGELYEGSTWEALLFAAHHKLDNLNIIIDENSLIILGNTDNCLKLDPIKNKIEGFGFEVIEVDGHNLDELDNAFSKKTDKSKIVLAKTIKGKGFSIMENKAHWHYWNAINEKDIEICRKDIE